MCIQQHGVYFKASSKRINLNDSSKRTIEKSLTAENISVPEQNEKQKIFLSSLTFSGLDKDNLKTVYNSYSQCIYALQTAQLTVPIIIDQLKEVNKIMII